MTYRNSYTLNCDLGEGITYEDLIIPMIDLVSVACGGHFGDSESIKSTLDFAIKYGKKVGAHPSYPDRENFGRKRTNIDINSLTQSLSDQIGMFTQISENLGIELDHIKFHGALYNDAAEDVDLACYLVDFLSSSYPAVPLFVPPHSEIEKAALAKQIPIRREVFGDRAYSDDYRLASRTSANSLFTEADQVISHLDNLLTSGLLKTVSGSLLPITADTICFHGDNPGILHFLPQVRDRYWR